MKLVHVKRSTLVFFVIGVMGLASLAQAATITVNGTGSTVADDGQCTLVEAITAANEDHPTGEKLGECLPGSPSGADIDIIDLTRDVTLTQAVIMPPVIMPPVIMPPELYSLLIPLRTPARLPHMTDNGLPPITSEIIINGHGKTIQRDSSLFPDPDNPCSGEEEPQLSFRIFDVENTGTLTLNDVTVSNGCARGEGGGGGISNLGTLKLNNSKVKNNAAHSGGGIENQGILTLINSTVSENTAASDDGGSGGSLGGGIRNLKGDLTLKNSTVSGNTAAAGKDATGKEVGGSGGGIENQRILTLFNSTVSGNTAAAGKDGGGLGGGIENKGELKLNNSTISYNTAINGAGIFNGFDPEADNKVSLKNSIVANNISGPNCRIGSVNFISNGNNLDSDDTCNLDPGKNDLPGTDPILGPLKNNGGPTLTHALLTDSPAVDRGDNTACPATDQRGFPRPVDGDGVGGAQCDIGAFELLTAERLEVNSTADAVDAIPGDRICNIKPTDNIRRTEEPECTLRAAIQEANALSRSQVIDLPAGTYVLSIAGANENAAATGDLDITDDLVILGVGAVSTIINGDKIDRVFQILGSVTVAISGVTIEGGNAGGDSGGAITNQGTLTLSDSVIRENTAGNSGGGIENRGELILTNITVSGNMASQSGSGIDNSGGLRLNNSTVSGNVTKRFGGGIANSGRLELTNSTVSGNQAELSGGGIYNTTQLAAATLLNSTVAENSGPGINNDLGGTISLKNTIIASETGPACAGLITSNGNNLATDNTCGLTAPGDLPGTNPRLGQLQDNGGTTFTRALLFTDCAPSPAIDAGDNNTCPTTDQRGEKRPQDGDGNSTEICDIGSYESRKLQLPSQPNTASRILPAADSYPDNPRLAYVMIGSPLQPTNPDPLAILGLGQPYHPFSWRLFHEDANRQQRLEYLNEGDPNFNFERGRGFWLITKSGATVEISGTPSSPAEPFLMNLRPGWNQIATPFNFPIDWNCIVSTLPDAIVSGLMSYGETEGVNGNRQVRYFGDGLMRPMVGYFVFARSEVTISICPLPRGFSGCALLDSETVPSQRTLSLKTPKLINPVTASGWRAKLAAAVGATTDTDNYLGVDIMGQDGEDKLDYPEPPPIHGLFLSFPHPEWNVTWPHRAADIRGISSESSRIWNFLVWTDLANSQVQLTWDLKGESPRSLKLWDVETKQSINMHEVSSYTYYSGDGGVRYFQVTAE